MRASSEGINERIEEMSREIKRLDKENQRLKGEYSQLSKVFEEKEARESVRTGIPLTEMRTGISVKTKGRGNDELERTPHPSKDGGALNNPRKGNPSLSFPSKDGETLEGNRGQRISRPPRGGETLSPQEEERMEVEVLTAKEGKGIREVLTSQEGNFPLLKGKRKPDKTLQEKPKPTIKSNVMVAAPASLSRKQQKELLLLEKNREKLERDLRDVKGEIAKKRLNLSLSNNIQQEKKTSGGIKAPMQTPLIQREEERKRGKVASTAPKTAPPREEETFATIVKRGKGKKASTGATSQGQTRKETRSTANTTAVTPEKKAVKKKMPRTAAVVITSEKGKYEEILREARKKISLSELGISEMKARPAITGGHIFEITGPDKAAKADKLAARLREAIGGGGVKITKPIKTAELRLKGLDASVTPNEAREALSQKGQCDPTEIKVGEVRRNPNGFGTLWARCPLSSVNKITEGGKLTIGWSTVRVEALTERPLQCYKCLEGGHVAVRCPNTVDRSNRCYRCGQAGQECTNAAHCLVCHEAKLPANHKVGSTNCQAAKRRREKVMGTGATPTHSISPSAIGQEETSCSQTQETEGPACPIHSASSSSGEQTGATPTVGYGKRRKDRSHSDTSDPEEESKKPKAKRKVAGGPRSRSPSSDRTETMEVEGDEEL